MTNGVGWIAVRLRVCAGVLGDVSKPPGISVWKMVLCETAAPSSEERKRWLGLVRASSGSSSAVYWVKAAPHGVSVNGTAVAAPCLASTVRTKGSGGGEVIAGWCCECVPV